VIAELEESLNYFPPEHLSLCAKKNRTERSMEAVPLGRPKIEPSSTSFLGSKLSLYQVPPKDNVSLEEFELYAIERLRGTLWYF